jgi:hypothetical protein
VSGRPLRSWMICNCPSSVVKRYPAISVPSIDVEGFPTQTSTRYSLSTYGVTASIASCCHRAGQVRGATRRHYKSTPRQNCRSARRVGRGIGHSVRVADADLVELKRSLDALADGAECLDGGVGERAVVDAAVRTFKEQGAEILAEVTPYLWQYYRSFAGAFSSEDRATYGIPELDASTDDIWSEVAFRFPPTVALGGGPLQPAECYLSFEADTSWEPEHGLQLVFENGARLCKVGPYDGHNTVAHAWGDASLLGVIFK